MREICRIGDPDLALDWVIELAYTLDDRAYGPEIRRLGRTLRRWAPQIAAWNQSHASNGPAEAANNLAKGIKRVAFGITNWTQWRIRERLSGKRRAALPGPRDWYDPPALREPKTSRCGLYRQ